MERNMKQSFNFGRSDVKPMTPESIAAGWDRAFARVRAECGAEKPRMDSVRTPVAASWDRAFRRVQSPQRSPS
jgi:hypothetical protein